jgi:AcrR family transcriptional regulator
VGQRVDAIRNRARLLEAGRRAFGERGVDASLEDIARRAGVGIGTLYRHFPAREDLVEAIYEEHIDEVVAAGEEAVAESDAWCALAGFLEHVLDLQARNLPLRSVFLQHPAGQGVAERRKAIGPLLKQMIARAREQGSLREDFTVGDLSMVMWSFAPLLEATAEAAPGAWRRHLRIVLDGMRPEGAIAQEVRPLAGRRLERAIEALRQRYHSRQAA